MKKVLYTATVLSHICQFHLSYLKLLQEYGYEVHIAARNNLAEKNGLSLKYIDKVFEVDFQRSPFNCKNIKAYKELKKIINREKYDLIVCNTPVGGILTRLAAKRTRKSGTKIIYIAHGFHFYKGGSKKNWILYYPIEKYFASKCDLLITINDEDYVLAKNKFKTNVAHMHGVGVDPTRFFPISQEEKTKKKVEMGYSPNDILILCVGELLPNKNQLMAIKAVENVSKKYPNIKLLVAGNGQEKNNLELYIKEHNLDNNIKLLGYCTNLEDYQKISDIGLSCSIREGLPLNVIESMLSKNVFIATKNRGHNELIKNNENGFLIEQNDIAKLEECILKAVEDNDLKNRLTEAAFKSMQKYTINNTVEEYRKIINNLK